MKNKKLLILLPALAMVLAGCGDEIKDDPKQDNPQVETVHVESVSLNKETMSLDLGAEEALTATVLPANASDSSVTWSSDNASVATVSERGKVTAVSAGTANITVTSKDGSKTAVCVVTVVLPRWGDAEHPISVASALANCATDLTKAGQATPSPIFVEGYVIKCTNASAYCQNIYLADSASETDKAKWMLCYSADYNVNKNISALYPGDKTMLTGYMQQYKYGATETTPLSECTLEMTAYNSVNAAICSVTRGTNVVSLGSHPNSTVTGLPESAKNGDNIEFSVAPANGYDIVEVCLNGVPATKDTTSGKYKGLVTGPVKVTVETCTAGLTVKKAKLAYTNSEVTSNLIEGTNNVSSLIDATDAKNADFVSRVRVDAIKNSASNNIGVNKAGNIRLYNYNEKDATKLVSEKLGDNNVLKISAFGYSFTQAIIQCSQNENFMVVKSGANTVTGEDGIYVLSGNEFTIGNTSSVNTSNQVWITSITLSYTVDERVPATSVTLDKDSLSLDPGESDTLTATVAPTTTNDLTIWSTSDANVATVADGVVKAVATGNATITCKVGDFTDTCAVEVKEDLSTEKVFDFTTQSYGANGYGTAWKYETLEIYGGANNSKGWTCIKMGPKSETLATLTESPYMKTTTAIKKAVSSIALVVDPTVAACYNKAEEKITIKVEVYSDAAFTTKIDTTAAQESPDLARNAAAVTLTFAPSQGTSWPAKSFYKVVFDCTNTTTYNGIACYSKLTFNYLAA